MYNYAISFVSPGIDEAELRDFLETHFSVENCSIGRSRLGAVRRIRAETSERRKTPNLEELVFSLLETGEIMSPAGMKLALEGVRCSRLPQVLASLVSGGQVRKVAHGLYMLASFPEPTPQAIEGLRGKISRRPKGGKDEEVLDFLAQPRDAVEVRAHLGVTRQAVDQRLKRLLDLGKIHRTELNGKVYLFGKDRDELEAEVERREHELSPAARKLLSALPRSGLVLLSELADFASVGVHAADKALGVLKANGLAQRIRIEVSQFAAVTDEGLCHEAFDDDSEKAPPSDMEKVFGLRRLEVLQVLEVLGPLLSSEITMALAGLHSGDTGQKVGQRIQYLRSRGLVATPGKQGQKQVPHELTPEGRRIVAHLKINNPLPSAEELRHHIRSGIKARAELLGGAGGESWRPSGRSLSMLEALASDGPLSLTELARRIDPPFANPRSVDNAAKELQRRGLVHRIEEEGAGTAKRPYKWRLTDEGRKTLDVAGTPRGAC